MKTKCKRCGRHLKSKDSIERGYGLVCALKEGLVKIKRFKKKTVFIKSRSLFEFEGD